MNKTNRVQKKLTRQNSWPVMNAINAKWSAIVAERPTYDKAAADISEALGIEVTGPQISYAIKAMGLVWPRKPVRRPKLAPAPYAKSNAMDCRRIAGFVAELYMKFGELVTPDLSEYLRAAAKDAAERPLLNGDAS
ncbi:MAG: hypothetical protein H0T51_14635 [Pirellulales bacterium]|nr:hypothetical protein [Pirellulales bacterium]